jgi:hypothetical protein
LDYIIPEAKENSYFGNVLKLRVYKDRIYVFDRLYAKALFIYTTEGKHVATVGDKKGHGPLEFICIENFEIDYVNNQLLTIDGFGCKFMIYDLDGNFVKRIDSNFPLSNAVLLPNGYILHAKPAFSYRTPPLKNNYQIILADDKNRIIKQAFEYDDHKKMNIQIFDIISAQPDGGFNFAPKFRDTIYSVSSESIIPKYAIDFGNNRKIPKSKIDELGNLDDLFDLFDAGNTCFLGKHIESDNFLHLALGSHENQIYVFYNKQTSNTISLMARAEITEYEYELYRILCSDSEGYFYGAFNFADIDELINLFPGIKKPDAAEDMNPVLFRYKVKI